MQTATHSDNIIENRIYDEFGNLTLIYTTDNDFDGQPESIFTYTYNTQGNLISQTQDFDGDGTTDSITTVNYRYDEFGNLTIDYATDSNSDAPLDGQADRVLSYTFNTQGEQIGFYDSASAPTPETDIEPPSVIQPLAVEVDTPGISFSRSTYTLTGQLASFSFSSNGLSSAGTLEYDEFDNIIVRGVGRGFFFEYTNIYDDNNNLIQILETPPAFPSFLDPYLTNEFEYDENNNLTKQIDYTQVIFESLSDPDLTAALETPLYGAIITSEFDANGNLTRESTDNQGIAFDPNSPFREAADGIPDTIRVFTYDANNNLIQEDIDDDADGTVDRLKARYAYDDQNREVKAEIDTNDDGILDYESVSIYALDAENTLTREITTQESSGQEDVYTFSYDDNGNPTLRTVNGQDVGSQQNVYDEFDNLIRSEENNLGAITTYAVRLVGTDGKNVLVGTEQDDILNGGGGNDRLEGRGGRDSLLGGEGTDTFVLSTDIGSEDTIFDFATNDILEFSGGLNFEDLIFEGSRVSIVDNSTPDFPFNRTLVTLDGFDATTLTPDQVVFA